MIKSDFIGKKDKSLMNSRQHKGGNTAFQYCVVASVTDKKEKMNSIKHQYILDAETLQSIKKVKVKTDWLLQEHNDPKKTSTSAVKLLEQIYQNLRLKTHKSTTERLLAATSGL